MKSTLVFLSVAVAFASAEWFLEPKTFEEAEAHCSSLRKTLLIMMTVQKNSFYFKKMKEMGLDSMWIGVHRPRDEQCDAVENCKWEYAGNIVDGQPTQDEFWGNTNGDHPNGVQHCVEVRDTEDNEPNDATHNWHDADCNEKKPYYCDII